MTEEHAYVEARILMPKESVALKDGGHLTVKEIYEKTGNCYTCGRPKWVHDQRK